MKGHTTATAVFSFVVGAATILSASAAHAQGSADKSFAMEAASGGMAEVKLGQLAQEKGSSPEVKQFGKMMETDHAKAGTKLKEAATKSNITLPEGLNKKDQATYDKLSKLSGASFDKAYAHDMVEDHQKDVAAFQKEANDGQDQNIKTFASQTLPTLQQHLMHAQDMEKSTRAAADTSSSTAASR